MGVATFVGDGAIIKGTVTGELCYALISSHHDHNVGEKIGITPEMDNLVLFYQ